MQGQRPVNDGPLTGAELDLNPKWVLCQLVMRLSVAVPPSTVRQMAAELREEAKQLKARHPKK